MKVSLLLHKRGISQRDVAAKLGIDHSLFNKCCNGWYDLPRKYVKPLAELLNVPHKSIIRYPILRTDHKIEIN